MAHDSVQLPCLRQLTRCHESSATTPKIKIPYDDGVDCVRAEQRLQASENDVRRPGDLPCPLLAHGFDNEHMVVEPHRRDALERGADGRAPGEADLAGRERRRSQKVGKGARHGLIDRTHISDRSYHSIVRLVLASGSPRRAELLRAAGFQFDTVAVDVDETAGPHESAAEYVRRLAAEKSRSGCSSLARDGRHHDLIVLAADTAVVVDGLILGKPRDDPHAAAMLRSLSGRGHEVLTGISVRQGAREIGRVESTTVYVATLSSEEIAWYLASGEGRDKAGAYAIQGLAARFIPRIEGSFSNVVGLPVASVARMLKELAR